MENKLSKILSTAMLSACMAVTYMSALFLGAAVSYRFALPVTFVFFGLMAVIYLLTAISRDRKTALIKWLISIPLAIPVWYWFVIREYASRALNWAFPDYGSQSGGGATAVVFLWAVFTGLCSVAILVSIAVKPKLPGKVWKIQPFFSLVLTVLTAATVIILDMQFN